MSDFIASIGRYKTVSHFDAVRNDGLELFDDLGLVCEQVVGSVIGLLLMDLSIDNLLGVETKLIV